MDHRDLPVDLLFQDHASFDQRPGIALLDGETHLANVNQRIKYATIAQVKGDPAPLFGVERDIELVDEGRHHGELDAFAAPVAAGCRCLDETGCRFQHHDRLGLLHLDHAGFQKRRRHADRVGAGARMGLIRLQDDEGCIGCRVLRREQQVDGADRRAARFQHKHAPQRLALGIRVQPEQLLRHGFPGDLRHAADGDLSDFTFGMYVEQLKRALPSHVTIPTVGRIRGPEAGHAHSRSQACP